MTDKNISFEFFPPKTEKGLEKFITTLAELIKANPNYFSVTFGAGGSTQKGTLDTVKTIKKQSKISAVPHLSCIGSTKAELISILQTYKDAGVDKVVALRGDLPSGMGNFGELRYANELVSLIKSHFTNDFHITVAAYPEYHPGASNPEYDFNNFKNKVAAGANAAITQYFYNSDAYFYFLDNCQKHNINIPIVPGIMPITNFENLKRFSNMCGAEIPRYIYKNLEAIKEDSQAVIEFGKEVVHKLCCKLLAGGAPGLHFYTLNQAHPSLELALSL